jgi:hypothetical protein
MKMHLEENIDEETRKCRWVVMVWPVVKKAGSSNFRTKSRSRGRENRNGSCQRTDNCSNLQFSSQGRIHQACLEV